MREVGADARTAYRGCEVVAPCGGRAGLVGDLVGRQVRVRVGFDGAVGVRRVAPIGPHGDCNIMGKRKTAMYGTRVHQMWAGTAKEQLVGIGILAVVHIGDVRCFVHRSAGLTYWSPTATRGFSTCAGFSGEGCAGSSGNVEWKGAAERNTRGTMGCRSQDRETWFGSRPARPPGSLPPSTTWRKAGWTWQ